MVSISDHRIRIIRIIARLNVGGPAKHVVWLTSELNDQAYSSLLVTGAVPSGEDDMRYFAEESGVTPLYMPAMSREISAKDAIAIYKLFRLFLRVRPHIVHTHTAKAGTVGRVAGFLYRWLTPGAVIGRPRQCKFVHTYHGHIFHSYYGKLKTRMFLNIEKLLARLVTDRLVVISDQQRREIHTDFGVGKSEQFRRIPLGLDLHIFENSRERRETFRQELGVGKDVILIGIVGRLTAVKNHQLFLQAVMKFKSMSGLSADKVRFVIIGDGSNRSELEELVRTLDLKNDVIFAGSRKDPERFYPALDITALTSLNEGTPLTLIEAMANARPVIATRVGGVVDLLGNSSSAHGLNQICVRGVSVPPGDAVAFAEGLYYLVREPELRREMGEQGRRFVESQYGKDRLVSDIKDLYGELLRPGCEAVKSSSSDHGLHSELSK